MGVLGNQPIRPNPGCKFFFFRVRAKHFYTGAELRPFDIAILDEPTLERAYSAVKRLYPSADVSALNETEFDTDGLPKLQTRTILGRNESAKVNAHQQKVARRNRANGDNRFRGPDLHLHPRDPAAIPKG